MYCHIVPSHRSCSTLDLVSIWMGDCLQAREPSGTKPAGLVDSAFYPSWDGKMTISFGAE